MGLSGFDETVRAIQGLGEIAGREVQLAALKKAAQPMADEMGNRCPRDTGLTAADFGIAEGKESKAGQGVVTVLVGAHAGKGGRAFVANFIENGVPAHGIAARPFMRPTYDEDKVALSERYAEALRPAYERVVRKYTR